MNEKQKQFEYNGVGRRVNAPSLSPSLDYWNKQLKIIGGLAPDGEPRLRLVWGGTATTLGFNQYGEAITTPKYPDDSATTKERKTFYTTPDGEKVYVDDYRDVPSDKFAQIEDRVNHFGRLRWILEIHSTVDELIAEKMISPREDWGVRDGKRVLPETAYAKLETKMCEIYEEIDGKQFYAEPNEQWLEGIRQIIHKDRTTNPESAFIERMDKLHEKPLTSETTEDLATLAKDIKEAKEILFNRWDVHNEEMRYAEEQMFKNRVSIGAGA